MGSNGSCGEHKHHHGHHHHKRDHNFCNFTEFSFGSNECRCVNQHLRVIAGVKSSNGYVMPYDAKVKAISWSFDKGPCVGHGEKLVLQVDGVDTNIELNVDESASNTGVLKGLDLCVEDGSAINLISRQIDELPWDNVCDLVVTVIVEMKCKRRPIRHHHRHPCQESVIDVYDGIGGDTINFDSWEVAMLNQVATYFDPGNYIEFIDADDAVKLECGIYDISYKTLFITDNKSSNIFYGAQIERSFDGVNYFPMVRSINGTHDLSGNNGAGSATGRILVEIPIGTQEWYRIVHRVVNDSTDAKTVIGGNNLVVKRLECSKVLCHEHPEKPTGCPEEPTGDCSDC